jgi:hypothetical protein
MMPGWEVYDAGTGAPSEPKPIGAYSYLTKDPDVSAIAWTLHELQNHATASNYIFYKFDDLFNKVVMPIPRASG